MYLHVITLHVITTVTAITCNLCDIYTVCVLRNNAHQAAAHSLLLPVVCLLLHTQAHTHTIVCSHILTAVTARVFTISPRSQRTGTTRALFCFAIPLAKNLWRLDSHRKTNALQMPSDTWCRGCAQDFPTTQCGGRTRRRVKSPTTGVGDFTYDR